MNKMYLLLASFILMPVCVAGGVLEDSFIAEFKRVHQEKDLRAMSDLVYWNGVEPKMKELMERSFQEHFTHEIESLETAQPTGKERIGYKKDGKTYRPNLEIKKLLVIRYKRQNAKSQITGMTFRLGISGGKYFITTSAPIP